jgi:UDP-N-acetylmuramate--alanine ligase
MKSQTPTETTARWQARLAAADPGLHIHLLGIGGTGLSAIATVLLELGLTVSGSDRQANGSTARLAAGGARIFDQQRAENLAEVSPDVVLISSAVGPENPERAAAEAAGLTVVKRTDFLPALLADRQLIAVAGTHGKSTTTSMIVKLLRENGVDAGYIIGTQLPGYGNAAAGTAPYFVLEADEYDHMFLGLKPAIAVITNVEWDHPDCFPTPASFRRAFMLFVDGVERQGLMISCADDPGAEQLHAYSFSRGPEWLTYGISQDADLRAINLIPHPGAGYAADLLWWNAPSGTLNLSVPGVHNVQNAMAALLVGRSCGVGLSAGATALADFGGTARRFERKGEAAGVLVIDDYAHHPTEVEATLAATRKCFPDRRIWAIFQPHTFSRTKRMLYRMGDSFRDADRVIVTDIYAAREHDDGSVNAGELVAASAHDAIRHIGTLDDVTTHLIEEVQPGDVVITLGAGDGYRIGELLLAELNHRQQTESTSA